MRKLKLYRVPESQKETAKHPETKWNFGCRWTEHRGKAHSKQNTHSGLFQGVITLKGGQRGYKVNW